MEHRDALAGWHVLAFAHERHHDASVGGARDRAIGDVDFLALDFGTHFVRLAREHEQLLLHHLQLLAAAAGGRERAARRRDFRQRLAIALLRLLIRDARAIHLLPRDVFLSCRLRARSCSERVCLSVA